MGTVSCSVAKPGTGSSSKSKLLSKYEKMCVFGNGAWAKLQIFFFFADFRAFKRTHVDIQHNLNTFADTEFDCCHKSTLMLLDHSVPWCRMPS